MKKLIVLVILLVSGFVYAEQLETPHYTPFLVHSADSNDAALTPDTSSWATCRLWTDIPSWANGLKVCFYAYDPNDPNGETFSYEFYVADYGGNAQLVASGSATIGGSKLSHDPINPSATWNSGAIDPNRAWVDTLGTITSKWYTNSSGTASIVRQNYTGLNDTASFIFDRQSGYKAWCRIYGLSAYTKVYCLAFGY